MFTGIIEATAKVESLKGHRLVLARPQNFDDIKIGSSIAISGTCLSVIEFDAKTMSFDVVETTLKKTKLGSLKKGDTVNLERAMKADGRFEGHVVTGHIEGVGEVVSLEDVKNENKYVSRSLGEFRYPPRSVVGNARGMRKQPTEAEEKLWDVLRGKKLKGLYFRRQRPIGQFIVDFYCEEKRLAVEVDGGYHKDPFVREYDAMRAEELKRRGVQLLNVTNEEVMNNLEQVLGRILKTPPPSTQSMPSPRSLRSHPSPVPGEGLGVGAFGVELKIAVPKNLSSFIVHHGSITIDGVALTVAEFKDNIVTIALIPHTLQNSTLGNLKKGDSVNLETDILAKYILQKHGR